MKTDPAMLFLLLLQITLTCGKEYKGCSVGLASEYEGTLHLPCHRLGGIYDGVALMPEFKVSANDRYTALDMCHFACLDRLLCKSWSYHKIKNTCQLYLKRIYDQGFEPQNNSPRVCYDRACSRGAALACSKEGSSVLVEDRFRRMPGSTFNIQPDRPAQWHFDLPDRCAGNSSILRAKAPLASKVTMSKSFTLKRENSTLLLTYDYMYEAVDDVNIILGFMYQTDKKGGLSNIFEMARADDDEKINVWQRKQIRLNTIRTRKYKIEINFDHIPGMTATTQVPWRIDNVCLVEL